MTKNWVAETAQTIIVSLAITIFVYLVVAMPNEVLSVSMEPTFKEGDLIITNRTIQWLGGSEGYNYKRGDIVVFQQPGNPDLIKRVVGLPGDVIMIKDGKVFVNDQELVESYLNKSVVTRGADFMREGKPITVPAGSYIMMGDNRGNSHDSRYGDIGFVKREHMKGKVILRYWPYQRISGL